MLVKKLLHLGGIVRLSAGSTINGKVISVSFRRTNGGTNFGTVVRAPVSRMSEAIRHENNRAKSTGENVVISSADGAQSVAIRYVWEDWPDFSITNGAGLSVSPFQADDGPLLAVKK